MPHEITDSNDITREYIAGSETEPLLTPTSADGQVPTGTPRSMHETIKRLFKDRTFVYWFIFKILYFTQIFTAGLFVPLYAAEWFGGCLEEDDITPIDGCSPDYTAYAYYATMFLSIGGFITFLSSSFMGHLSDKYGRKQFFFIAIITWMIPRLMMIFYIDFYMYFSLSLLQAVNGGDFFIASKGYLADIIPNKNERIIGYGFGQSAVGIGCLLGSIMAVIISEVWDDYTIFIGLAVFYALILIYTQLLIQEPMRFRRNDDQYEHTRGVVNPFKYLGKVCKYDLIFYLTLTSLLMAVTETGIMSSLFAYIGNEFVLDQQGSSTLVYGIYAVVMAIAVILAAFSLAFFKGLYNELDTMMIAICIKIMSLLLLGGISLFPLVFRNYFALYCSAFLYGSSFFIWPTIVGLLSKYLKDTEQGTGFGILDSWTAVANIIAPFGFGYLYVKLYKMRAQWVLFLVAIFFCVASIIIIAYPLRRSVKEQRHVLDFKHSSNHSLLTATTTSVDGDQNQQGEL